MAANGHTIIRTKNRTTMKLKAALMSLGEKSRDEKADCTETMP